MTLSRDLRAVIALMAVCLTLSVLAFVGLAHGSERGTLSVLRSFPVHVSDRNEEPEKRDRRLAEIASGVDAATSDRLERAALLTLVKYESGAAAYVHEGRCSEGPRGSCDHGKAVGHFQLHPNDNHPEIPASVEEQAKIAIKLWRWGRSKCARVVRDAEASAFVHYGTGGSCAPTKWGDKRAATMREIARKL